MGKNYIERRIIKSGIELCEDHVRMKGSAITPDDLRAMNVRTLSPIVQSFYIIIGCVILAVALWVHSEVANMAIAVMLLLVGVGNIGYAIHGKPKPVGSLGDEISLVDLTADIVKAFVKKSDQSSKNS